MTDPTGLSRNLPHYGDPAFSIFLRKAFIKAMGYTDDALGRPIIGIVNTFSGYNACHQNIPDLIEAVSRGVMLNGGIPVPFPIISIHETFSHPTSMYLRNLMAMDAEEMIRAQPMDAVVLIGGCDKTVPALLMGAISANVPAIMLVTGPMLAGSWRGERLGACTDCRRFWGRYRSGGIGDEDIAAINNELAPTVGTCGVMGTASTMALATEALGMMLPGAAAVPAVNAERRRIAERTGARAIAMATEKLTPDKIVTARSITNALQGCSCGRRLDQRAHSPDGHSWARRDQGRSRWLRSPWTRNPRPGRFEADRPGLHGRSAPGWRTSDDPKRDEVGAAPRLPDRDRADAG